MRETIEKDWANIYFKSSYKTLGEKGIICTIIIKKELLERRIARYTKRTHNCFFHKPDTKQELVYTGFASKDEYKGNSDKGKQLAFHRAYATYHGEHIEILKNLTENLKRIQEAIDKTEEIERREMAAVKKQTDRFFPREKE